MKFMISRTSGYKDKPCEEAFQDKYTYIDVRTVDDPGKISIARGLTEWWYKDGLNHRIENGWIRRDFPNRDGWFIEFATLDELYAFIQKYESVVIQPSHLNDSIMEIEIYDAYRE